jgi:hypothetical protein
LPVGPEFFGAALAEWEESWRPELVTMVLD